MDNVTITKILSRHSKTAKCFLGCYPSDSIPDSDVYPFAAIINTDKTGYPGKHWVAIYVPNKNTIEYFDSFGELPNANIGRYLLKFENIHMNKSIIQSLLSNVCGNYCIYFVIKRCCKNPYKKILKKLNGLSNPDAYVRRFVYDLEKV